jgi:hypothetical protein
MQNLANNMNLASITEPGMYIQRPKFYNFKDDGYTLAVNFYLFNTITENAYLKNIELVTKLLIQNTPHRHNRILVDPPCIYELTVPGRGFFPYTYISKLDVEHVGTKRVLESSLSNSKKVIVPDAFKVSLEFKSLIMDVNNLFIPEMGSGGIDVNKRFGINELIKEQQEKNKTLQTTVTPVKKTPQTGQPTPTPVPTTVAKNAKSASRPSPNAGVSPILG